MIKANTERARSDSKKWHKYHDQDIIPLWIADMDFDIAEPIAQAIAERNVHPVYGYPYDEDAFIASMVEHCVREYGWAISPDWVVPIPGCVPGLNFCRGVARARGKSSGVTTIPTYPPMFLGSAMMDFHHHKVPCVLENGRWTVDFAALDQAVDHDTGLLLLCHPHNPIGRRYEDEELAQYAQIAKKHDLIVCSDEIHCDLILNGKAHRPFATLNDDALARTITLMAPSKTWNIAGLCCAFAIIADANLRADFRACARGLNDVNVLGRVAGAAAYRDGQAWRQDLIAQLQENAKTIVQRVNALTGMSVAPIEATYLAFLDCRALPVDNPQRYFEQYGLGFADGVDYGAPGFVRLNFGCSPALLSEALDRLETAVKALL